MLTHLKIKNFRGIRELSITDVGRVNLIVGRNDAGKTSLLEAVRLLLSGDPRHLRRVTRNRMERRPTDFFQDYQWAFYQAKYKEPVEINGVVNGLGLSVQAMFQEVREETLDLDLGDDDGSDQDSENLLQPGREIVVKVTADNQFTAEIRHLMQDPPLFPRNYRRKLSAQFPNLPSLVWLGTNRPEIWSYARRYSDLYRSGGAETLLSILRDIEPRLHALVVLTIKRNEGVVSSSGLSSAVLEADLGFDKTLPLDSMGEGFSHIISILSAIGAARDGLCLIDEVDNGIHYSLLPQVWRSAFSAMTAYDCQVWATTHSYDCLDAIYQAFHGTPEALRVHRLERNDDGVIVAHTFNHAMLGRALERGLEVR